MTPTGHPPANRWLAAGWWAGVSGIVGVVALALAVIPMLRPRDDVPPPSSPADSPATATAPPDRAIARTPWLGLQLWQNDERILFAQLPADGRSSQDVVSASLSSSLFYLRMPRLADDVAMQLCAWTDDSIFSLSRGQAIEEIPFFRPGTAMADTTAGSGSLLLDDHGNHYLVGSRLEPLDADQHQVAISTIQERTDTGIDDLPRPWGRVFLTALVDANRNGVVDTGEYEYLILDFT